VRTNSVMWGSLRRALRVGSPLTFSNTRAFLGLSRSVIASVVRVVHCMFEGRDGERRSRRS
jgi:hypothetical protein